MKTMGAAKFKEQCLALLDQLDAEGLVIFVPSIAAKRDPTSCRARWSGC